MLQSPSSLMYTPDTYIEGESSEEIKALLNKYNYVLTAPIRGEEKRSIIKTDLNGDSKEEIIVLYKKSNVDAHYGFLILTKSDESLKIMCNETFQCKNIDSFSFTDINNDNTKEILINVSSVDNNTKTLGIYKFSGKTIYKLFSRVCTDFSMFFKASQTIKPYIVLIEDKDNYNYKVKSLCVYQWQNNNIVKLDSTDFSEKITDAVIKVGKYDKDNTGIFCTYNHNSEFVYSDVYTIKNGVLRNITVTSSKGISYDNNFVYPIKSTSQTLVKDNTYLSLDNFICDVDEDGIFEFRFSHSMVHKTKNIDLDNIDYWYKLLLSNDTKIATEISKISYYNEGNNYTLCLPGKVLENTTISTISTMQEYCSITDFYISTNKADSTWIFSISVYDKLPEGYTYPLKHNYNTFITNYGNKTYVITYLDDYFKSLGLSNVYMKNDFFIFNNLLSTPRK